MPADVVTGEDGSVEVLTAPADFEAVGYFSLDTRKTLPGLRQAQKHAVRVGGGKNQCMAPWHGVTQIMIDDFSLDDMRRAVAINAGRAELEVSGGVNLDTVRAIAKTGVDRISIGKLTKDVTAVEFVDAGGGVEKAHRPAFLTSTAGRVQGERFSLDRARRCTAGPGKASRASSNSLIMA